MEPFGPQYYGSPEAEAALRALSDALQQRHGNSVAAVLFYGSCLRSGDLYDGLVDLYVIVDTYRKAHPRLLAAFANRLLPPNVYYLQIPHQDRILRCKYAVLSREDLRRGVSRSWFESYIWGRFCQPVAVAFSADAEVLADLRRQLRTAAATFLERALPCVAASGPLLALWEQGLALSYRSELRAEGGKRPGTLVEYGADHFRAVTRAVADTLRYPLRLSGDDAGVSYDCEIPESVRRRARAAWALRRVQGKLLSVARLLKALATFEGGFDYIAWKLERHSGRPVEIPSRVRKYPLIFVWGLMWKLYREGVFR